MWLPTIWLKWLRSQFMVKWLSILSSGLMGGWSSPLTSIIMCLTIKPMLTHNVYLHNQYWWYIQVSYNIKDFEQLHQYMNSTLWHLQNWEIQNDDFTGKWVWWGESLGATWGSMTFYIGHAVASPHLIICAPNYTIPSQLVPFYQTSNIFFGDLL